MIEFVTLFLGLVLGEQRVELAVAEDVAAVHLLLDGAVAARLRQAPWEATLDFGQELRPHRLEAVALDAGGRELARSVQRLNLPRPPAEVTLILGLDPEGEATTARLVWESLESDDPSAVRLEMDGTALEVADPASFVLPPYDPRQLHFLRAEVDFSDTVSAVAEATFGGLYADEVRTQLTAVPIRVEARSRRRDPTVSGLKDRFLVRGEVASPVAVERGPVDLVVVRDRSAERYLKRLYSGPNGDIPVRLQDDESLRVLWSHATLRQGSEKNYSLFAGSSDLTVTDTSLLRVLAYLPWPRGSEKTQRLADAVAVAGLSAVERNRRRAVILILGDDRPDRAELEPATVRRYLDSLGVPLVVWSVVGRQRTSWGPAEDVSRPFRLSSAVRRLRKELDLQRLVWFDGKHLPQEVELRGGGGSEVEPLVETAAGTPRPAVAPWAPAPALSP